MRYKLFAVALSAVKREYGPVEVKQPTINHPPLPILTIEQEHTYRWEVKPASIYAYTQEEAQTIGKRLARECWPSNEGWTEHDALVMEVPKEHLKKVIGED